MDVLESYPRRAVPDPGARAGLHREGCPPQERRQVRMFVRRDRTGAYLSCLVFLPRDRYTTSVRKRMEDILLGGLGGASIEYTARVTESVLAGLHFVVRMPVGEAMSEVDVRALERELTWQPAPGTTSSPSRWLVGQRRPACQAGWRAARGLQGGLHPRQAVKDLTALLALEDNHDMSMAMYVPDRPDDEAELRLKIFRRRRPSHCRRYCRTSPCSGST